MNYEEPYGKYTLSFTITDKIDNQYKVRECILHGYELYYEDIITAAVKLLKSINQITMINIVRGHTKEFNNEKNI